MTVAPLVVHVFPTFAVGGAQVRFVALANRFKARWRHVIISLDGNGACAERLSEGVPFTLMTGPPAARGGAVRQLWDIRSALDRLQPDVLVTGNWGSIEWALANLTRPGTRHIHTEDGFGPDEAVVQHRRRILARRVALRRSTVVLPSTILMRSAREVWRLPPGHLHHIPNGLDLARFRPDGPVAALEVPGHGPIIGTVAALRAEKSIDRLLQACALLRQGGTAFRLVVAGDGPERPRLEAMVQELGLAGQVLFMGHLVEPAETYRAFDLFALSSSTEQMPFSVLEAMASGLAVVSTDVGDVSTMLSPQNRPFVTPLDAPALASAMRDLLHDSPRRQTLGVANRCRAVLEYDEEAMFQKYAALIDNAALPV